MKVNKVETWIFAIFIAIFSHINQPCQKWANFLRKSSTKGKLAQNGQLLYDNSWAISLMAALLLTFMSYIRPVPLPQGDLLC